MELRMVIDFQLNITGSIPKLEKRRSHLTLGFTLANKSLLTSRKRNQVICLFPPAAQLPAWHSHKAPATLTSPKQIPDWISLLPQHYGFDKVPMTPARHICKNPSTVYSSTQMKDVKCRSERMTVPWHRTAQLPPDSLTVLLDARGKLLQMQWICSADLMLRTKTSLNSG